MSDIRHAFGRSRPMSYNRSPLYFLIALDYFFKFFIFFVFWIELTCFLLGKGGDDAEFCCWWRGWCWWGPNPTRWAPAVCGPSLDRTLPSDSNELRPASRELPLIDRFSRPDSPLTSSLLWQLRGTDGAGGRPAVSTWTPNIPSTPLHWRPKHSRIPRICNSN